MAGAAFAGRAIVPEPFDGRLLGEDFRRVRPPVPEFMVFGGMMVGKADIAPLIGRFKSFGNFIYSAKLFARYLADRLKYPRGTRIMMGNALIGRLFYSLRKRGVPILFHASIADVTGDRRGVSGARVTVDGKEILVKTRKGVVLATGGYAHNESFRQTFMPQPVPEHSMSYEGNRGDGLALGQRLGAAIAPERGSSGLWTPVSIVPRPDGSKGLFPHLVLDRAKPGLIAVNSAGRRFVNEAASYHDFVLAMFESNERVPSIPAWLICDTAFMKKYGLGVVYPGHRNPGKFVDSGYLVSGRTLDELADKIAVDAAQLRATVARYNGFAETGVDIDFGKGETELNRFNGDAGHKPNPCIGPDREAAVLRARGLAGGYRGEHGFGDRRRCARAGHRRTANSRALCLRQRHGVGDGGKLSGPRHDAGPGDRVRLSCRDACKGRLAEARTVSWRDWLARLHSSRAAAAALAAPPPSGLRRRAPRSLSPRST